MAQQKGFILASVLVLGMLAALIFVGVWYHAKQTVSLWHHFDTQQQELMVAQSVLGELAAQPPTSTICDGWRQPVVWQAYAVQDNVPSSWRIEVAQDCFREVAGQRYQRDAVRITIADHSQQWVTVIASEH